MSDLPARSAQMLDFPVPARRHHNLPPLATRVVGRADVIGHLAHEVTTAPVTSIVGAGGIGKTTVALAVAEQARIAFPDGVWLVDFAPMRDAALVPHAIASATGLVVHSADILGAFCRSVRQRHMLLVFDNCEHIVPAIAACLRQVRQEAPGVHVLATSRTALGVDGEQVHRLAGLAAPPEAARLTAAEALAYPAIALFAERATDRLETFVLGDGDSATVAAICRSLDGIALAIELAAMRVDFFGVHGLHQQLADRFRLLTGRRAGLERHRTMAATLDWSYSLVPAGEAGLLRAVSVFTGAFRLAGAAAVAAVTPGAAAVMLAALAAQSLLAVEADAAGTSYRLLETTRAYCLEKLAGAGDDRAARQRHADYVCAVVELAATAWGQQQAREWGAAYGGYLGDLRAALAWASAAPAQTSLQLRLTAAGTLLWNHFSLTDESRVHLTRALAAFDPAVAAGTRVEMHLQFALAGAILYTRGITPEARFAIRRALRISEQLGDTDFRLRCLRLMGTIELFFGETDAGISTLQRFLSIATAEDPSALAEGETHLGVGEMFVGRLDDARQRMERLVAQHAQDFNDARFARFQYSNTVNVMIVLSHAQWLTGQADCAASTADTILAYGRQAAHELSLSIALAWNSLLYFWLARDDDCSRHVVLLDDLVEQHGIVTWRPIATFCRGALAARTVAGCADGIVDLQRAVAAFQAIGHHARLPYYVAVLAEALGRQARFPEAEATIAEALALAVRQNEQWCLPELLRIHAAIAAGQGRYAMASALLARSIAVAQAIGAVAWQQKAAHDLAALP